MAAERTVICFDLDGTLADTTEAHVISFQKAFKKNNLPYKSSIELIDKFGQTADLVVKKLFPEVSGRKLKKVVEDKVESYVKEDFKISKHIPGVAEALEELKKKYKLVLVSNATHPEILSVLKKVGINPRLFDAILGKGEVHKKPNPHVVEDVEKATGSKVEYFVGDTIYDIKTGKEGHVKTVAVLSGIHDIERLGAENPTIIIKSVALLPEVLSERL